MTFPAWSVAPFILMLAAIAVLPLVPSLAKAWDRPRNQLIFALLVGGPVAIGAVGAGRGDLAVGMSVEYAQFIVLLFSLFVVSGGIHLRGDIEATPLVNTIFLAVGGILASFVGTTGAAMLLVRPILNTNRQRKHVSHTVVFCIFIVANCGGLLTPLGDPPLFLGMLRGVPFAWTLHLFPEWLFVNALLLLTYWAADRRLVLEENSADAVADKVAVTPLRLEGAPNLLWIVVIVVSVGLIPSVDGTLLGEGELHGMQLVPWRELVMLAAAAASYLAGDRRARHEGNRFSFKPIAEVAAVFLGIFLTMIPALEVVRDISQGLSLDAVTMFVLTGGLSSVLDNTPTYATFFEIGRTMPGASTVAGVPENLLAAISLGAVLCGALTYIGNGPNLMVKAVAEDRGVRMPSFARYSMLSLTYLVPVLASMVLVFLAPAGWATLAGMVLAAALVIRSAVSVIRLPAR